MSAIARLSSGGQVQIPAEVREAHGWREGTELEFVDTASGVLVRPVEAADPRFPPVSWDEFVARIPKVSGPTLTDAEIERIVADEAGRRFDAKTGR